MPRAPKLHFRKDALSMLCGIPRRLIAGDRMIGDLNWPRDEMCSRCVEKFKKSRRPPTRGGG